MKLRIGAALLLSTVLLAPAAHAVESSDVLQLAEDAARWLAATQNADGSWPDNALATESASSDLASGAAGKVVFLVGLYRATGNEDYLRQAQAGGDSLLSVLDAPAGYDGNERRASLYSGIAGIGLALRHLHEASDDERYAAGVARVISLLDEWSTTTADERHWSQQFNDLLFGDAGTVLFLAEHARATGDPSAQRMAHEGARFLLGQARTSEAGRYWMFRRDKEFNLPNFSHGTAGVAYVLATVATLTGDTEVREAARDAMTYLQSVAELADGQVRMPYGWGADNWQGLYEFGWAHGVAGTALATLRLQQSEIATEAASCLESRIRKTLLAANLVSAPPKPFAEPSTPFDYRFGRAGTLAVLAHWSRLQPANGELHAARDRVFEYLRDSASRESQQAFWEVEAPAFMGGGQAQYTGVLHGAAGIGLSLLQMHAELLGREPYVQMPDSPFGNVAKRSPFEFQFSEIAENVWAGARIESSRFPVMGNTVFVIGDDSVVVFDGGGAAAMTEQIIAKIRSLTNKPVSHVITSHWHGDHNFGIYRFAEEYPNVHFVAHRFTNDLMHSPRIAYIDKSKGFLQDFLPGVREMVETGVDADGNKVPAADRRDYAQLIEDAAAIDVEYQRLNVTPPNVIVDGKYVIESGTTRVEVLHLGQANTEGDLVMWLPQHKIVATGDIVVAPSPYAFNVPPRAWAQTLRNLKALGYEQLVPGHGALQRDSRYVDLLIEAADDIAAQRDALLESGVAVDKVAERLDFSAFEQRFTGGDEDRQLYYEQWYETPFRAAAVKALSGAPMVEVVQAETVPFDSERWSINANTAAVEDYLGEPSLRLQGGTAILQDAEFTNAVIEFDVAVDETRGFAGAMFRAQDEQNYEHFYIRPHQSGNPDANQYTPVINGVSAWQLYHGDGYGTPVEYRHNEWMHIKIVFAGSRADIYIDSERPTMRVHNLKRDLLAGGVGLNVAAFGEARFANFSVMALPDAFELPSPGPQTDVVPPGRVMAWQVSDAPQDEDSWRSYPAEKTGLLNLATAVTENTRSNVLAARVVVESDSAQSRELRIGYSDAAAVYLNGVLLFKGDNTYQSRDYRYLGTIGLFDTLVLPLKAGANEVRIDVSEVFGGWGVMAEFSNANGLTLPAAQQ